MALAILLAAIEMLTVTTLVWSAAAALTAVALWLGPGLGWRGAGRDLRGASIVLTFAGRAVVGRVAGAADGTAG